MNEYNTREASGQNAKCSEASLFDSFIIFDSFVKLM